MSDKSHLSIAVFVSEGERAAVQLAANHLARSLSQAADVPWTCDCIFSPDLATLRQGSEVAIVVTSLLSELGEIGESWPRTEQRLRRIYATLGERGTPVFICTILRHVSHDEEPEAAVALRIRIRRLNLLAAEISRETGVHVIDLDRVLADIGARRLQTDYRLAGNAATEKAGHFIALTLVENALDAFIPFEVQDAAKLILASHRPELADPANAKPEVTLRKTLILMGNGRRRQIVSPVAYTVEDSYAGWIVRQVLRGTIGPADAFRRLVQAVRKRGVRESVGLLATGLFKQIDRRK